MINVKQWMALPLEVRLQIAKDFNLKKTGSMGLLNNKIVSDGYTQDDILKININTLGEFMDSSNENFDELFKEYVDLIQKEPELTFEIDMGTFVKAPVVIPPQEEVFNPNIAPSGDTETYFGTKIKPVTYKPNVKKTTKRK